MRLFLWIYGCALAFGFAGVAYRPNYFGNVGFLVLGLLAGIYPAFIIEEIRRSREVKILTKALFHELANRVGRCCFDFEDPWHRQLKSRDSMDELRLRKFLPEPPIVYPAVAKEIPSLGDDVIQTIVAFYISLAAWRRDLENMATAARASGFEKISGDVASFLALRLRQTLEPGRRALDALGRHVPNASEIERNAMRDGDQLFASAHPHAGKTVRERIHIYLKATEDDVPPW